MPCMKAIAALPLLALAATPLAAQEGGQDTDENEIVVVGQGLEETPAAVAYAARELER